MGTNGAILMRGMKLGMAVLLAGAAILSGGTTASADPEPIGNEIVGSVGAPLINANVPCPAPWQQGGVNSDSFNLCDTSPVGH